MNIEQAEIRAGATRLTRVCVCKGKHRCYELRAYRERIEHRSVYVHRIRSSCLVIRCHNCAQTRRTKRCANSYKQMRTRHARKHEYLFYRALLNIIHCLVPFTWESRIYTVTLRSLQAGKGEIKYEEEGGEEEEEERLRSVGCSWITVLIFRKPFGVNRVFPPLSAVTSIESTLRTFTSASTCMHI